MLLLCLYFLLALAALSPGVAGFWRLPCSAPVVIERADPIVSPDAVSSHAHTIMGSNALNFTMDYALTQTATCSSCKVTKDLSSYWTPSLYYHGQDGNFIAVPQISGMHIYYEQRPDPTDPEPGIVAFPPEFRMVAGTTSNRNYTDTVAQNAVSFVCLGTTGPATNDLPKQNCPGGLRAQLNFPACWDGVNADSADHKSHVVYGDRPDGGPCPASHPKRLINLFYEVTWAVDGFKDGWYDGPTGALTQPFVFSNGDPTGYGFHGDFLNGWDVGVLQTAIDTCNDPDGVIENCAAFSFFADDDLTACKVLPRVHEAVGGTLPALPGCNPVQPGPAPAVPQTDCGAPTTIGDPIPPSTDVSALGWQYVACVRDPAGQPRTLDGLLLDQPSMTVEACVGFCSSSSSSSSTDGGGYQYAGMEQGSQCFCGNSFSPDRMPTSGTLGDCGTPCAGNGTEVCGGPAWLSLYQRIKQ